MDEETRKERELDALEIIAAELEKLRMLKEHELGARVEDYEGSLNVEPFERQQSLTPPGWGVLRPVSRPSARLNGTFNRR